MEHSYDVQVVIRLRVRSRSRSVLKIAKKVTALVPKLRNGGSFASSRGSRRILFEDLFKNEIVMVTRGGKRRSGKRPMVVLRYPIAATLPF